MNIYEKLMHVQQHLKAPKNQYNDFGSFYYRNCEDIQEALKPVMAEVKAVLLLHDDIIMLGSRYYIKATASFLDTESGEHIDNVAYAREAEEKSKMDMAQITGSCSSYARKYALNGLFCIDDAKDPDATNNGQNKGNNKTAATQKDKPSSGTAATSKESGIKTSSTKSVTSSQIKNIRAELVRTGAQETSVLNRYSLNRIEDMTAEQYKKAMDILQKMASKIPEAV